MTWKRYDRSIPIPRRVLAVNVMDGEVFVLKAGVLAYYATHILEIPDPPIAETCVACAGETGKMDKDEWIKCDACNGDGWVIVTVRQADRKAPPEQS